MSENNALLHACAAAALAVILVYAGEQWRGHVHNDYIKYALWTSSIAITSFVVSFLLGFLNGWAVGIAKKHEDKAEQSFYYNGQPVQEKVILSLAEAKDFQAENQHFGWAACRATYIHRVERFFTFIGTGLLAAAPILFAIGVITG